MKMLLTICTLVLGNFGYSQHSLNISHFCVDSTDYYEITDCKPGSLATFYSSPDGGRCLGSYVVDTNGEVLAQGKSTFHPAMVLNDGLGGSLQVAHFDSVEFAISNRNVVGNDRTASTEWMGKSSSNEDISFQVYKSTDGKTYHPSHYIPAHLGNNLSRYTYSEVWAGAATVYKIAVISKCKGIRYVTPPMLLSNPQAIAIVPTLVTDKLSILLPEISEVATYSIISNDGRVVRQGKLTEIRSSIQVDKLPAGSYFVNVVNGLESKTSKVIKM